MANANYVKGKLLAHGWNYIVIDFRWYDTEPPGDDHALNQKRTGTKLPADAFRRLLPAENRFPSSAGDQGFTRSRTAKTNSRKLAIIEERLREATGSGSGKVQKALTSHRAAGCQLNRCINDDGFSICQSHRRNRIAPTGFEIFVLCSTLKIGPKALMNHATGNITGQAMDQRQPA